MSMEIYSLYYSNEVTSNRFDQEQLEYLIDGHLEGLLAEKQTHHEKEFTEGGRCTYILAQQPAPTVD